jgi:hypothetical protein
MVIRTLAQAGLDHTHKRGVHKQLVYAVCELNKKRTTRYVQYYDATYALFIGRPTRQ